MNVIDIHNKILSHLDQNEMGRVNIDILDSAFNYAHNSYINHFIIPFSQEGIAIVRSGQLFERMMNVLSYYGDSVTADVNTTSVSFSNFFSAKKSKLITHVGITTNLGDKVPTPIPYKEKQSVVENVHTKPTASPFFLSYVYVDGQNFNFLVDASVTISKVTCGFIRTPQDMTHGILYYSDDYTIDGDTVMVNSPTAIYDGVTYRRGEEVLIVDHTLLTSGEVLHGYTSSVDVDESVVDEICGRASEIAIKMRLASFGQ